MPDALDVCVGLRPLAVDPRPLAGIDADPQHKPVFPARRIAEEVVRPVRRHLVGLDDMHRLAEARKTGRGRFYGDAVSAAEDFFPRLLGELGLHPAVPCPRVVFCLKINHPRIPRRTLLHHRHHLKALPVFLRQKLRLPLLNRFRALEIVFDGRRVTFNRSKCDEQDPIPVQKTESDRLEPVQRHQLVAPG